MKLLSFIIWIENYLHFEKKRIKIYCRAKLLLDPAKMKEEYDKRLAEKDQLNMVVIGKYVL